MAKPIVNYSLKDKKERESLIVREAPYWEVLAPGLFLGYRKGRKGGHWLAKSEDPNRDPMRIQKKIGAADDGVPSKLVTVIAYKEAANKVLDWSNGLKNNPKAHKKTAVSKSIYTVGDALDEYLVWKTAGKKVNSTLKGIIRRTNVLKFQFGSILIRDLKTDDIEKWMNTFPCTPPNKKKKGEIFQTAENINSEVILGVEYSVPYSKDEKRIKARKATANRYLADLKAALNFAFRKSGNNRIVDTDIEWRVVKPFKGCDNRRETVLEVSQQVEFVNICSPDFRPLALVALLTGARYGELADTTIKDFNFDEGTLFVDGKTGPRYIPLSDQAILVLEHITSDRPIDEYIFLMADGLPFKTSSQQDYMDEIKKCPKFSKMTFHELRHTCITTWVKAGIDLAVIADAVGNSVAIIEKNYKKLKPDWIRTTINEKTPVIGIASSELERLRAKRKIKKIEALSTELILDFDLSSLNPKHYVVGKTLTKTEKFRPSDEKLKELVWSTPARLLKKVLNVSDTTISNWCKDAKIEKPGRGYWQQQKALGKYQVDCIKPVE